MLSRVYCHIFSHDYKPMLNYGGFGVFADCTRCGAQKHAKTWVEFEEFNDWVRDEHLRHYGTEPNHLAPALYRP